MRSVAGNAHRFRLCTANGEIFSFLAKFFLRALCASARFLSSPEKKGPRRDAEGAERGQRNKDFLPRFAQRGSRNQTDEAQI